MRLAIVIIFCNIASIKSLTCENILELPSDTKFTLSQLQTVQPKHIVECLAHLGKEPLPIDVADFIWKTIINFYGGASEIPEKTLMILHWVTIAVKPEDYANLTLDTIDVVENFGLNYNLSHEQLAAIADRVREDFAGKSPEDYTYYDLMALKQILCQFNTSEIERIHPSAYREAATMIGKLENCGAQAMKGFATLAMNTTAFGSPVKWTKGTIKILGTVSEYLPHELTARFEVESSSRKRLI